MDNLAFINRVLELTNQERSRLGLSPLTLSPLLSQAAQTHSQNMALQDFFNHTGLDGSSPSDRARIVGYTSGAAENIAAGYTTPEAVVTGWMNSPGHRENILNPNYRTIGVGYHFLANDTGQLNWNHYWTQMFGFAADPMPMVSLQSMNAIQYGTEESDRLFGTPGNDTLFALGGDDTVQGGLGNDYINGMQGRDRLSGEAGNDTVRGGKGNDTIFGDDGNDWLYGDLDQDFLYGGNGDDILYGGKGNDWLEGGAGNDTLYGDLGSDTLIGGPGTDVYVLRVDLPDTIYYNDLEDYIGLTDGLTYGSLQITQGTGLNANDTLIRLAGSGTLLAILPGVSATSLDPGDFLLL
ncbi:CAP domain-containing protein [Kamptonema cortianum]|nr:CAP domain-containing protein [Kamptonema cortianum]